MQLSPKSLFIGFCSRFNETTTPACENPSTCIHLSAGVGLSFIDFRPHSAPDESQHSENAINSPLLYCTHQTLIETFTAALRQELAIVKLAKGRYYCIQMLILRCALKPFSSMHYCKLRTLLASQGNFVFISLLLLNVFKLKQVFFYL
jgi:hypothetical protein